MIDFLESAATGQYKYLYWFILGIIFIYIPGVYLWRRKKKNISEAHEMDHPDAIKVFYKRSQYNDLLTVYSVNDEEPVMHSRQIFMGVYLRPGKNILGVQYQWTTVNMFNLSGYETNHVEPREITVKAEIGKEYALYYDHDMEDYVFAEIKT